MLLTPVPTGKANHHHEATLEYLAQFGFVPAEGLDGERALEILCDSATDTPTSDSEELDFMQLGIKGLSQVFQLHRAINRTVQGCKDEGVVRDAITWMFVDFGRQLGAPQDGPIEAAIERTQEMMHLSLGEYQARAVSWWNVNRWAIVLARGRDRPAAISIMLPLSTGVRDNILGARQMTYDCAPEDVAQPSSRLLHEGVGYRPLELGGEPKNASATLYTVVLAQAAALSKYHRLTGSEPLTLLSIPGTPINRKRLAAYGYQPTGKHMRLTGIEFVERIFRADSWDPSDIVARGIFTAFSLLIGNSLPPP